MLGTKRHRRNLIGDAHGAKVAAEVMLSDMGQRALREKWGRGLYRYVLDNGRAPHDLFTLRQLQKAANDFRWDLEDMRKGNSKDPLHAANLRLWERAAEEEDELRERFLKSETVDA